MVALRILLAVVAALFGMLFAAPIVLLALPFWIVALLTRIIVRQIEPPYVNWKRLMEFAPVLGWKTIPNLNAHYITAVEDGVYHVITDSNGWPGTRSIGESDIIVFGDSYASGYGVNAKVSFSELKQELSIKAVGAPGYNMVQEVLLMRQLSSQLSGKLVVWFIFLGNDLSENLAPNHFHDRMPFVRETNGTGSWEIVTNHVSREKWPYTSARFRDFTIWDRMLADIHSPTSQSKRAFSACEFLIEKGNEVCSRTGARLFVMTIPDPLTLSHSGLRRLFSRGANPQSFDPDLPDKRIKGICSRLGIPFVEGKKHLDACHYKGRDPHWNEIGHQKVAELLRTLYYEYGLRQNRVREGYR